MSTVQNQIFLSYAWANEKIANEIDQTFDLLGITLIRDVRDVSYKTNMNDFMARVRSSGFVLTLISDEYLKSENCLYEVLQLMKDNSFRERTLQVVLTNAKIFDLNYRLDILKYWKKEKKRLKKKLDKLGVEYVGDEINLLKHYNEICNGIGAFLNFIVSEQSPSYDSLKNNNFEEIFKHINFHEQSLVDEIFRIRELDNSDERDDAILTFIIDNPTKVYGHALASMYAKRPERGVFHLDKAIELHSNFSPFYYNRGIFKVELGDFGAAMEDYNKAIKIDPIHDLALGNRGLLKFDLNDISGAIEDYDKAISINPKNPKTYFNRAQLEQSRRNFDKALKYFDKAINADTNYVRAYFNRGTLRLEMGDLDGSLGDYDKAIELNPNFHEALGNRGNLKGRLEDYEGALSDLFDALEINPNYAYAYFNLSDVKNATGDLIAADEYLKKAKDLDPNLFSRQLTGSSTNGVRSSKTNGVKT